MIDIVVPIYAANRRTQELAYRSLELLRQNTLGANIIVVDNGWHEDRIWPATDLYLRLETNQGYAGGVNAGLEFVESPIVVVSSLDVFVGHRDVNRIAAISYLTNGLISPLAWKVRDGRHTGEIEQPSCAYWGGIFAAPLGLYRELNGMDTEHFRLRHADTDFGIRAAKAGYTVSRAGDIYVEHHDPSLSTLFMPVEEVEKEYADLFAVHGEFPMYEWKMEMWQ